MRYIDKWSIVPNNLLHSYIHMSLGDGVESYIDRYGRRRRRRSCI